MTKTFSQALSKACALLAVVYIQCVGAQELREVGTTLRMHTSARVTPRLSVLRGDPPGPYEISIRRPTLIHFWATWCGPCVEELPKLNEVHKELKASGVDLILVSIDEAATVKVPPFLKKLNVAFPTIYWDPRSDLYKEFGTSFLPLTIFIAPKKGEVGRIAGAVRWDGKNSAALISKAFEK